VAEKLDKERFLVMVESLLDAFNMISGLRAESVLMDLRVKNLEYQVKRLMSQIRVDEEGGEEDGRQDMSGHER
jgi:hypothetical protein